MCPQKTQASFKQKNWDGAGHTKKFLVLHRSELIVELMRKHNAENCRGYITITPKNLSLEENILYLILIGQKLKIQTFLKKGIHIWQI